MDKEIIVSAAHYDKTLDKIIPCVRHADDIFYQQFIMYCEKYSDIEGMFWEQGFITNKFRYVDRYEAMSIALENNQIKQLVGSQTKDNLQTQELFSENLY